MVEMLRSYWSKWAAKKKSSVTSEAKVENGTEDILMVNHELKKNRWAVTLSKRLREAFIFFHCCLLLALWLPDVFFSTKKESRILNDKVRLQWWTIPAKDSGNCTDCWSWSIGSAQAVAAVVVPCGADPASHTVAQTGSHLFHAKFLPQASRCSSQILLFFCNDDFSVINWVLESESGSLT